MALCSECPKRHICKSICEDLKKEITGRGKTSPHKPKTYLVDFSYIENPQQSLNPFQIEVLNTIKNITSGTREKLITRLALREAIDSVLNDREKKIIQLFVENRKQEEIARELDISQPRVNFLLQRALGKLKESLERGL